MRSNRQWQRRRRRGKIIDVGGWERQVCEKVGEKKSPFCLILTRTNPLSPGTEEGLSYVEGRGGIPSGLTLAAGWGWGAVDRCSYLSVRRKKARVGKQKKKENFVFLQSFWWDMWLLWLSVFEMIGDSIFYRNPEIY